MVLAGVLSVFWLRSKENGAAASGPFCKRLLELIQKLGGPGKPGQANAKQGATVQASNEALALANKERHEGSQDDSNI